MDGIHSESRLPSKPCALMPSVAVHRPYAGPRIGGLGPTLQTYRAHHRIFPGMIDIVLRSLHDLLNNGRERIEILRPVLELFTPLLTVSAMK